MLNLMPLRALRRGLRRYFMREERMHEMLKWSWMEQRLMRELFESVMGDRHAIKIRGEEAGKAEERGSSIIPYKDKQ